MTNQKPEIKYNEDTYGDGPLIEFTLEALPGDTVFPGRERKGRPPIPEWMKNPTTATQPKNEPDLPR